MASRADYVKLFDKIADAYLNHTVVEVNKKYYRVGEIEFYLNDYQVHKDTFTHGQGIQKETAKWYFHKFGSSYKSGTYKGLDVAIGKGDGVAAGGILLRSLMPLTLSPESSTQEMKFTHGDTFLDKVYFIEGPCNCVNRLLQDTKPADSATFDIKDLVERSDFSLDVFDPNSCMHLLSSTE